MLSSLQIRDFAIIDELSVDFSEGFNVVTGETGAGKTILVDAISLVQGSRAESDHIRKGSDKATVTAVFSSKNFSDEGLREFGSLGIDVGDEVIVHRVISSEGRGKILINGVPVTNQMLKGIVDRIIDISSQHEHQLLLDAKSHPAVLDSFGGHMCEFEEYLASHRDYMRVSLEVKGLEENRDREKEKLEFLKFQLDEIEQAHLEPGEEAQLEERKGRLKHATLLEERARGAEAILYGNAGSVVEQLDAAVKLLSECSKYDAKVSEWIEPLSRARSESVEVARGVLRYADALEADPGVLEEIEDRIHLIRGLTKKHGGSVEACLKKQGELAREIELIVNYDGVLSEKREQMGKLGEKRRTAAEKLSNSRKKTAKAFQKLVEDELAGLGMIKAKFSVGFERLDEALWDESGAEKIEFMIAPNVGEPVMPLARIVSGGELSRIMLAIKAAASDKAKIVSTSVFDEVDSGIGGAVASCVGRKLKQVSKGRQVICITHLPQVAVHADRHLKISKGVSQGRTVASVQDLSKENRVNEIARMLAGDKITDATLAHASEMLNTANSSN